MAKIGIVVPVYGVEPYLARCVDSILAQSYRDFVLVLVDDGSPDKCGLYCDDYARKDQRIVVLHQQNAGLSAARNAGLDYILSRSDVDYITFVDSDDAVAEDYLASLYRGVDGTGASISTVLPQTFSTMSLPERRSDRVELQMMSVEDYWCQAECPMVAWGKLFPRTVFEHVRFPVGKIHEDEFLTHQLIFRFDLIGVVASRCYFYYERANSIVHSVRADRREMVFEALESQVDYFRERGLARARLASARNLRLVFAREFKALSSSGRKDQDELRLLYDRFEQDLKTRFLGFFERFEARMTVAYVSHPIVMRIPWMVYRSVVEIQNALSRKVWSKLFSNKQRKISWPRALKLNSSIFSRGTILRTILFISFCVTVMR